MKNRYLNCTLFHTLGLFAAFALLLSNPLNSTAGNAEEPAIIGHWDLTLQINDQPLPSWLEVKLSGNSTLVGRFVAEVGSSRPVSEIIFKDGKVTFNIPTQWYPGDKPMYFEGELKNDKLSGKITNSMGREYSFTGVRAPSLVRSSMNPEWGEPITLFNGKNLDNFHPQNSNNQWVAEDGILKSPKSGTNLVTDQKFDDFKLHIEFKYPAGGNSGIYLRGRYEVQVEDSKGKEPASIYLGGVYGFLTPNEIVAKDPGQWQACDITLIGRRVTIVINGKTVICDQIIPGITGGAIDSNEGEPGPIMLQGDHLPIEYRNIIITPAK